MRTLLLLLLALPGGAQVIEVKVKAGGKTYVRTQPVFADKAPVFDGYAEQKGGGEGVLKMRFQAVLDKGVDLQYNLQVEDAAKMRLGVTSTVALTTAAAVNVAKCGPFEVTLTLKEPAQGKTPKPTANAALTAYVSSDDGQARCSVLGGSVHRLQADADVMLGDRRRILKLDAFPSDISHEKSTLSGFFEVSGGGGRRLSELMKPRPFPVDKKILVLEGAGTKLHLRRHPQPSIGLSL